MLWWGNQSPMYNFSSYFYHTSSHRHHQMYARNVGCLFLWNKLMSHNSMYIKTNISKHFTQEQFSLPTSGREIPCCHL